MESIYEVNFKIIRIYNNNDPIYTKYREIFCQSLLAGVLVIDKQRQYVSSK